MNEESFMTDRKARRHSIDRQGWTKQPEPFAHALDSAVRQLGITKKMQQAVVLGSWSEIVGEHIARVTEAERIENGILFVKTLNAPWRNELTMRRLEILEKINNAVGAKVVKEIRFR